MVMKPDAVPFPARLMGCGAIARPTLRLFTDHMTPNEEGQAVTLVAQRLQTRFPDLDSDTINRVVESAHHVYDGRPIRDFVPVLVEREARDVLHRLPRQQGSLAV